VIAEGLDALGIAGSPLCIHVSLRSFRPLRVGPEELVDALLATGSTVLIPTMANEAFSIPAPADDRPAQNGIDYSHKDQLMAESAWPGMSDIYDSSRTETDEWLGATSAHVAARPDRQRTKRPGGEFAAVGALAETLIGAEESRDVYGPLRALVARDGWIVLMGVDLTSMTLLHLAEVEAGRRPFIRWGRGPDGAPMRVRGGECSNGFENLAPALAPLERTTTVGGSRWRAYPARGALRLAADAIRANPEITRCDNDECIECRDAIAGGPLSD
jgi:aminoglycoside N3'-acetyltransferase